MKSLSGSSFSKDGGSMTRVGCQKSDISSTGHYHLSSKLATSI